MNKREKPNRQDKYEKQNDRQNPSFFSSLLDEIYRSTDNTAMNNHNHPKLYADTGIKKSVNEAVFQRKPRYYRYFLDNDHENRIFGSTSSSSDSSSSLFSSSDTEFMYCKKISRASCFGTSRPKPRMTDERLNRAFQFSSCYNYGSATEFSLKHEETLTQSKTRATKTKAPVSPGGRLGSFINSLFSNTKKSAARTYNSGFVRKPRHNDRFVPKLRDNNGFLLKTENNYGFVLKSRDNDGFLHKSQQNDGFVQKSRDNDGFVRKSQYNGGFVHKSQDHESVCSSASSFSRSCLSKRSEKSFEAGIKRSVRFHPVNVIFDEDNGTRFVSVSLPSEREKLIKSPKNVEDDETAREFMRDYDKTQKKDAIKSHGFDDFDEDDDDDDDAAESDSSSDLFELDGIGDHRYREELPVYETTCAGLIM